MTKWSDDGFLDEIRAQSDPLASDCVRALGDQGVTTKEITRVFREMTYNGATLPGGTPAVLRSFLEETSRVPADADLARLQRGQVAFMTHAVPGCLALLHKSLPEGYAAPTLTEVLGISAQLQENPYHRLLGTLQFLIDISSPESFEPGPPTQVDRPRWKRGHRAIVTTQQVRLMHAGIRVNVAPRWSGFPAYQQRFGTPVNLEDMLGTLMGFSLLVVTGLRGLEIGLGGPAPSGRFNEDEEAFFYVWRIFGRMFGIYPAGSPGSEEFLPASLTEAQEFYDSYRRRHYVGATDFSSGWRRRSEAANPVGVGLGDAHVRMLGEVVRRVLPSLIRPLVPGAVARLVPRIYLRSLIGATGCARVGVRPVLLLFGLKWVLFRGPRVWAKLWRRVDVNTHVMLSETFLESLIKMMYEQPPGFVVPSSVGDLEALVEDNRKN